MKSLLLGFTLLFSTIIYSQEDSLHLIFTITGDNTEFPIYNCGTLGDVNGDGFSDFVVTFNKFANLYFGDNSFSLSNYQRIEPDDTSDSDNIRIFGVGDINKDGYDDFVLSAIRAIGDPPFPKSTVYFYFGGDDIDTIPAIQYEDFCLHDALGVSAGGGDVNGDGFNDVLIGNSYNWCDAVGRVHLFYGNYSLSGTPGLTFESDTLEDFFGESLCSDGDINGDGYDDIIISAPDLIGDPYYDSKVYFYFGDSIVADKPNLELNKFSPSTPVSLSILPDFNGDGINDLYISSNQNLYFGGNPFDTTNYIHFSIRPEVVGDNGGYIGDINKDGYSDLLLGDGNYVNNSGVMVGSANIYLGSNSPDTTMDYFLEGETQWSGFGYGGTLGDINGDGYTEFAIIARGYPDINNKLGKLYIYSMKEFIVGVKDIDLVTNEFHLKQNYPNPFNPSTKIIYQIPQESRVIIKLYDVLGREIRTLVNEYKNKGKYKLELDGSELSSGVYIYRITAGEFSASKKLVLMK